MGHLAERYRDPSRSGVYRATDVAVPRAAAREAGAAFACIDASDAGTALARLAEAITRPVQVLLIAGLDAVAASQPAQFAAVVAALEAAAQDGRARRASFFAVVLDPEGIVDLPPLYREAVSAGKG